MSLPALLVVLGRAGSNLVLLFLLTFCWFRALNWLLQRLTDCQGWRVEEEEWKWCKCRQVPSTGSILLCPLTWCNEIPLCAVKIGAGLREDLELQVSSASFKNSNFCLFLDLSFAFINRFSSHWCFIENSIFSVIDSQNVKWMKWDSLCQGIKRCFSNELVTTLGKELGFFRA